MWAVHRGDGPAVMGNVVMLVNTIIEKNAALRAERPGGVDDEALRRAIERLGV